MVLLQEVLGLVLPSISGLLKSGRLCPRLTNVALATAKRREPAYDAGVNDGGKSADDGTGLQLRAVCDQHLADRAGHPAIRSILEEDVWPDIAEVEFY